MLPLFQQPTRCVNVSTYFWKSRISIQSTRTMMSPTDDNDDSHDNDGWDKVPSKEDKRNRRGLRAAAASNPLAWMNELPQIPEASFEPSMLLLVGLPGSGKSTFSTALCRSMPWKYVRINQDELKNRPACERAMRRALDAQKCPIIDRCNVSVPQRRKFQANVPIDCIVFDISAEVCVRRCQTRRNHPTIAPSEAWKAIRCQSQDYEAPHTSEGFRTITTIRDDSSFEKVLVDLITKNQKDEDVNVRR